MGKYNKKLVWLVLIVLCFSGCLGKDHMPTPSSGDYEGKVVDRLTGVGIPNVEVTIGNEYTTVTDLDGEFIFSTMPPGDYQVSLKRAWYQEKNYQSKHVGQNIQWDFELEPEPIDGGLVYFADKTKNELNYLNLTTRQVVNLLQITDSESNPIVVNGSILYDSNVNQTEGGCTDVYQYTPAIGSQSERLFPSIANSGHPSVSADGNIIVFHSKQGETWYVMLQTNGGLPQKLFPGKSPVINSEGTRIAYLNGYTLNIYNLADQSSLKCNYSGKINDPSWYPVVTNDGSWQLLVEAWPGDGERRRIYLIRSDAPDQLQPVTYTYGNNNKEDHRHPGWSANGSMLFFSANILFSGRKDIYYLRWDDVLSSGEAAQWIMVSPGSGSKNNPSWTGTVF